MALLLAIDTAVETASVCLTGDGQLLAIETNNSLKDHAAWIQPAIKRITEKGRQTLKDIDAIAVSIGPGSYTGLRVGLATAKGLCYALNKPLITINTLRVMAFAAAEQTQLSMWLCPMIDARRMEAFIAVFNQHLEEIIPSQALILDSNAFYPLLQKEKILFFGNGSKKFSPFCKHPNAEFAGIVADASHLATLSAEDYINKKFASLAYSEPLYLKEFHTTIPKPLI